MTSTAQGAETPSGSVRCWCCGGTFDEADLSRLGAHHEVAVCLACARWLHRRARAGAAAGSGSPGARAQRWVQGVRGWVVDRGIDRWPVLGRALRRLDRHLP
jgi:hypothetical protein